MIFYQEIKDGKQSYYEKIITNNDDQEVFRQRYIIPFYTHVNDKGVEKLIIYNDNMEVIRPAYNYLNNHLAHSPVKTKRKIAYALRQLYCFLYLFNYNINEIDYKILNELCFFLKGKNTNPDQYKLITKRNSHTVNDYLGIYRGYFEFAGIKCKPLFDSKTVKHNFINVTETETAYNHQKYKSNLRESNIKKDEVPKYISPEEFRTLYRLAISNKDKTAMIIMHLMYGYGLRLGEVLGLTIEDITEIKQNKQLIPVIYLRNRIHDAQFQFAKNRPHVSDSAEYATKDYIESSCKIILTYKFYDQILEYIDEYHEWAYEKYPDNYDKGAADIVSVKHAPDENHYVFLNRYGKVLSDQTWNNSLKEYFKQAGISIDYNTKANNLSHRFRHGFAMFHAHFSPHPVDALVLQKLMRHKSLNSTMRYYNPTMEDEYKIKTEFQNELYDILPELQDYYTKDEGGFD